MMGISISSAEIGPGLIEGGFLGSRRDSYVK
jgi:hypothetical protein